MPRILYVVITVTEINEVDDINDVVQITTDKKRAEGLVKALQDHDIKALKKYDVDDNNLYPYERAAVIVRYLNGRF